MARIGTTCLVLFSMWVALASSAWAQATPGYTMHQITYPNSFETFLFGVNDKGNMIGGAVTPGEFEERTLYFAKYGSAYVELEESFGLDCVRPHAINNHKHIIGLYCEPDDPPPYNFGLSFEHVRTSWTQIQVPGAEQTVVEGNNDAGDIVGTYFREATMASYPFVLKGEVFYDLPPSPIAGTTAWPRDINKHGHIVGLVAAPHAWEGTGFLLVNGVYKLFTVPGARIFDVRGINDNGHIVGSYLINDQNDDESDDRWRGYLLKNGKFTTINVTKDSSTTAVGINNLGHIAGTFFRPYDEWLAHGFLAVPKK